MCSEGNRHGPDVEVWFEDVLTCLDDHSIAQPTICRRRETQAMMRKLVRNCAAVECAPTLGHR
jgi:hypothetical protein